MSRSADTSRPSDAGSAQVTPAQLAHELNNLLDGSARSVGLAIRRLKDTPLDATQRDALDKLESADELMSRMIDLIKVWGQTSDPAPQQMKTRVQSPGTVGEALEHALALYEQRCEEQGITLAAVANPATAHLPADALYNVFSNAIKNAIESIEQRRLESADPNGSDRIEVRVELDDEEVIISVADTGAGLSPTVLDDRGDLRFGVTTKSEGQAIGLGLCRQIAHALRGRLSLRNRRPRGAVLTFRFPLFALQDL